MPEMCSATPKTYGKTWLYFGMDVFRQFWVSVGLDATLGGYHYLKGLEDGRNGFSYLKNPKITFQMCLCSKIILSPHLASCSLWFKKCPRLVPKYENTAQMWLISKAMRSKSQNMIVGTPMGPIPHVIWQPQAASLYARQPASVK